MPVALPTTLAGHPGTYNDQMLDHGVMYLCILHCVLDVPIIPNCTKLYLQRPRKRFRVFCIGYCSSRYNNLKAITIWASRSRKVLEKHFFSHNLFLSRSGYFSREGFSWFIFQINFMNRIQFDLNKLKFTYPATYLTSQFRS